MQAEPVSASLVVRHPWIARQPHEPDAQVQQEAQKIDRRRCCAMEIIFVC